jgi:hypothetical protein
MLMQNSFQLGLLKFRFLTAWLQNRFLCLRLSHSLTHLLDSLVVCVASDDEFVPFISTVDFLRPQ